MSDPSAAMVAVHPNFVTGPERPTCEICDELIVPKKGSCADLTVVVPRCPTTLVGVAQGHGRRRHHEDGSESGL